MTKEFMAKIHNKFDIEVIDGKTGEVKQKAQAKNVVLNQMWNYLLADSYMPWGGYIHYGSGTGTPSATDTSLFTFQGAVAVTERSITPNYTNSYISRVCSIQLGTSAAVGITLTEIGLASGSGSNTLSTHAMLQDMNGNPITIVKTDTDIINIYATVFLHWNTNDDSFSLSSELLTKYILGATTTYSLLSSSEFRLILSNSNAGLYYYNGLKGDGGVSLSVSRTTDSANKKLTYTPSRVGVDTANFHGIRYILSGGSRVGESGLMIRSAQNTWPKTQITGESVAVGDGTTTEFRTKFNFPEDATVYVNGVAVSSNDVTVKKLPSVNFNISGVSGWYNFPLLALDGESTDQKHIYAPARGGNYINGSAYVNIGNRIFYNPMYSEGGGILSVSSSSGTSVQTSDNLVDWTTAGTIGSSGITLPVSHRTKKYYKFLNGDTTYGFIVYNMVGVVPANIVFNTAPANGDVITIDYKTDCICKDANHVLDLSMSIQFGTYQGA